MLFYPVAAQVSLAAESIYCGLLVFRIQKCPRRRPARRAFSWTTVTRLLPSGALVSAWTSWRDVVRRGHARSNSSSIHAARFYEHRVRLPASDDAGERARFIIPWLPSEPARMVCAITQLHGMPSSAGGALHGGSTIRSRLCSPRCG